MALPIEDIVQVTITTETARVSRAGFGTPLIASYHTEWVDRVRTYSSSSALTTLVDEGFATDSPTYLAMQAVISQNPRPRNIKVGRRDNDWIQVVRLVPSVPVAGEVYTVTVGGTEVSVTADGTPTVAEICTALAAAINALPGAFTATGASGTHVDVTADVAGTLFGFTALTSNLTQDDQTVDGGMAADLALIRAADSDFYGLIIDSNARTEILLAAAWAETQKVLFIPQSSDSDIPAAGSGDLGSALKTLNYSRTGLIYHEDQSSYAGAAWLGKVLPLDPGSETWAFKTLAGVPVSDINTTQAGFLGTKRVNFYSEVAGLSITRPGLAASNQFFDITRFVDWLTARIQESVFALIANAPKLPYTDESVDLVKGQIYARLLDGVEVGGLVDGSISVDAPLVADIDSADRADRILPDVTFGGQLAGAIHAVIIQGNLTI